jgi:Flp pilus assembly pilin Flp
MRATFGRLLRDDSAQELVEYAYLAALVGLVGALVWIGIVGLLGERYAEYDAGVQNLWEPPTPQ